MGWIWAGRLGIPQRGKEKRNKRECTHLVVQPLETPEYTRLELLAVTACCCNEYAAQNAAGKVLYRAGRGKSTTQIENDIRDDGVVTVAALGNE